MARRQHMTLSVVVAFVILLSITYVFSGSGSSQPRLSHSNGDTVSYSGGPPSKAIKEHTRAKDEANGGFGIDMDSLPKLNGDSVAPKLENATLKAELGRATWKFLHTMVARYPEKPTPDERKMLVTFFNMFGFLYPCGECAKHFRELMEKYPPQTSSRDAASSWLCAAHNKVNVRLGKEIFDCSKLDYDCGCGDDKKDGDKKAT